MAIYYIDPLLRSGYALAIEIIAVPDNRIRLFYLLDGVEP